MAVASAAAGAGRTGPGPGPGPGAAGSGPAGAGVLAVRALRFWLVNYRRTWRGSIYTSVANPVLYLGAMGLGLGTLVDQHGTGRLGGVSYLAFLAPGLLAATGMQTAMNESTFPVMAAVKWLKTYQAAAATPLRPGDLFRGHLLFTALRTLMNSAIFLAVMAAFGAVQSAWAVAALPVCVLTGLAFAAPVEAWAITREKDTSFSLLIRFGLIPLFLFSGTFFPVTQLPGWIQPVAYATPLWHGVALCRSLSLGTADLGGSLLHVAYLVALTVAGLLAGQHFYRRRLYV
ncbi:MAG TPA: ABC transporter permease [Streptosporangiaceae bacterium]|nr:ABC transporter permease [Streptosporangiaceae bacterium]